MNTKIIQSLLIVTLFFSISFATLMPTNDPMRIEGNALVDSSAVDQLNISFYINNDLAGYALTNSTGYYIATIGGNNGDTVTAKVCGITYTVEGETAETTFEAYSVLKGNDMDLSLQSDGTTGCTCSNMCEGGYCVNPGLETGVCSSNDYYCDNDGTCESAYGETTSTCSNDCSSGGGSTGGTTSGGSITTSADSEEELTEGKLTADEVTNAKEDNVSSSTIINSILDAIEDYYGDNENDYTALEILDILEAYFN